jgi:hypothetical protein
VEALADMFVIVAQLRGDLAERQPFQETKTDDLAILVVRKPIEGRADPLSLFVGLGMGTRGRFSSLWVRMTPRRGRSTGLGGIESLKSPRGSSVFGLPVTDVVHTQSPHDLENPGAEHRQGLGIAGFSLSRALELAERLPGPQPGSLSQVGRTLVGPTGVGEAPCRLPEPGPDDLKQGVDRRAVTLLGPDEQVSETVR